jgi:pimeloyl-ACP methyl ester carboxylesterase
MPAPDDLQADVDDYLRLDPKLVDDMMTGRDQEGFDIEAAVKAIRCRALLIGGESRRGGCVRDSDLEFFAATVPDSGVIQIRGAGHGLVWDEAVPVIHEHIVSFLDAHLPDQTR